jgi:hypothetical protein
MFPFCPRYVADVTLVDLKHVPPVVSLVEYWAPRALVVDRVLACLEDCTQAEVNIFQDLNYSNGLVLTGVLIASCAHSSIIAC